MDSLCFSYRGFSMENLFEGLLDKWGLKQVFI
jgi:hypothetical protein